MSVISVSSKELSFNPITLKFCFKFLSFIFLLSLIYNSPWPAGAVNAIAFVNKSAPLDHVFTISKMLLLTTGLEDLVIL